MSRTTPDGTGGGLGDQLDIAPLLLFHPALRVVACRKHNRRHFLAQHPYAFFHRRSIFAQHVQPLRMGYDLNLNFLAM
jgi:hypothetical protein